MERATRKPANCPPELRRERRLPLVPLGLSPSLRVGLDATGTQEKEDAPTGAGQYREEHHMREDNVDLPKKFHRYLRAPHLGISRTGAYCYCNLTANHH